MQVNPSFSVFWWELVTPWCLQFHTTRSAQFTQEKSWGNRISVYFDRAKNEFVGLDEAQLKCLKDAYPHCDVEAELSKMSLWLQSSKGLRRKGNIGFVLNWLKNNYSSPKAKNQLPEEVDTPIRPELNRYLEGLWKGREHILELNRRKS